MIKNGKFPNWDDLYRYMKAESMPWFYSALDPNLDHILCKLKIYSGAALDIGAGPGTQAMALAEKGFEVTATDISRAALKRALTISREKGLDIDFRHDDILNTKLKKKFDFVFDRGCFHVLPPERRLDYVSIVYGLIKPNGFLFIKCFSHLEPREEGPYRFTMKQINALFSAYFTCSVEETVYQCTLEPLPLALFAVLQKL